MARAVFPRQTVVTVDTGAHTVAVTAFWDSFQPRAFLCSSGLGMAGYALPSAMAAKLVTPNRPVLAFVGDGGFLRSLGDLAVAVWHRLPIVAIVFVDGALSASRAQQEQMRYAPLGVLLGAMDIPRLTEGVSALGTLVEDEESLGAALKDALEAAQPAVIAVRVRPTGYRRMLELLYGKAWG
jgi:acetolactate synthase-1/2/3 large subunit